MHQQTVTCTVLEEVWEQLVLKSRPVSSEWQIKSLITHHETALKDLEGFHLSNYQCYQ